MRSEMAQKAHTLEVLTYIVDEHDRQIKSMKEHHHQVNKGLTLAEENLRSINVNFEKLLVESMDLNKRMCEVDQYFRDISIKSKLLHRIASLWPILLIIVFIISAIDYQKIDSLFKGMSS